MFKYPFADFNKINNSMNEMKSQDKLGYMHEAIGGKFHDDDKRIMTGPVAAIVNMGGFAVEIEDGELCILGNKVSKEKIIDSYHKSIGMSSFMSYLNPKGKSLNEIAEVTLGHGHNSVLHQINLSILITGISIGVEHEFSTQRDIVHLSRITVAKTTAQNKPCLVLPDIKYLDIYKSVLQSTDKLIEESDVDNTEIRNLLFPTAKASGLIINGSVRNLMKLIALKNAGGKEAEFIDALVKIEDVVSDIIK